ncbi:6-phosphofructokinase [Halalkalibacter flavus]|uniref:6-phosphofructokinase n=1 Tax=Halalkalibacter flavus TaxID=3090668 RepID=UPI002FC69F57
MKIAMINIEAGYSIVNQLTYDIVGQLINDYEVYAIEVNGNSKPFLTKDLAAWRTQGGNLLRCFSMKDPFQIEAAVLLSFDAIIVLGGEQGRLFSDYVAKQVKVKSLYIPVSIYNDIKKSKLSLGYDTALNAVIDDIYKIEDSVSSCRHDRHRLFGVQVPGKMGSHLAKDVFAAVDGLIPYWGISSAAELTDIIRERSKNGKNHSFIIFDDRIDKDTVKEKLRPMLADVSWRYTKVDEAQCMGMLPTAIDRILAKQIASGVKMWIKSTKVDGFLALQYNKTVFKLAI